MSFWSSLTFVRTGSPTNVSTNEVGSFFSRLKSLKFMENGKRYSASIQFGSLTELAGAIDRGSGIVEFCEEPAWDREDEWESIDLLILSLSQLDRPIRQANFSLGFVTQEIFEATQRLPDEENDRQLSLDNVSFTIGPQWTVSLESDAYRVGWMGLSMAGNGYFFPWDNREAKRRAEQRIEIQRVMDLCRVTWPASRIPPSTDTLNQRRMLNELWLYEDIERVDDWYWFIQET